MLGKMAMVSLPRSNSCSLYVHSNHFRQRLSCSMICKIFHSPSFGSESSEASEACSLSVSRSKQKGSFYPFTMATSLSSVGRQLRHGLSRRRSLSLKFSVPTQDKASKQRWNTRLASWALGTASVGMCLSFSTSSPVCAESPSGIDDENNEESKPSSITSRRKKVYTDYSITGIPGDGRCLFRSIVHGVCIRSGRTSVNESDQRKLADELRAQVADELVSRRAETEWFIEGDFDTYVAQIRRPHVWGGEPELLMASHVLQVPITVYMLDEESGGLISIAEYGQEYGKENPIRVLYHGYGHYDSLQIPAKKAASPSL